jgi:hypothetical protein
MTPGRRRLLLLLALAAAAVAAFFLFRGGDDGGREVTHAELVDEVSAICAELERENRALEPPFRPYDTFSESFFSSFLENVDAATAQLEELQAPAEDQAAFDPLVEGYVQIRLRLQEAQGAASTEQDPTVVALISEIDMLTRDVARNEQTLGVCAGRTSARIAISELLERTVPNPLEETGELGEG